MAWGSVGTLGSNQEKVSDTGHGNFLCWSWELAWR